METNHDPHSGVFRVWPLFVAALIAAVAIAVCVRPATAATAEGCAAVNDGASYIFNAGDNTVSLTLVPKAGTVRCEDSVASLVVWEMMGEKPDPAWPWSAWPQKVKVVKTITLGANATEPVSVSIPAPVCSQVDAYAGTSWEVGMTNTSGGNPHPEVFINSVMNGTGDQADGPWVGPGKKYWGGCQAAPTPTPTPTPPTPSSTVLPPVAPPVAAPPVAPRPHNNGVPRPRSLPHTGN